MDGSADRPAKTEEEKECCTDYAAKKIMGQKANTTEISAAKKIVDQIKRNRTNYTAKKIIDQKPNNTDFLQPKKIVIQISPDRPG